MTDEGLRAAARSRLEEVVARLRIEGVPIDASTSYEEVVGGDREIGRESISSIGLRLRWGLHSRGTRVIVELTEAETDGHSDQSYIRLEYNPHEDAEVWLIHLPWDEAPEKHRWMPREYHGEVLQSTLIGDHAWAHRWAGLIATLFHRRQKLKKI